MRSRSMPSLREDAHISYVIGACTSLTHYPLMIFVKTHSFTRRVNEVAGQRRLFGLSEVFSRSSEEGDPVEGTGDLRKIRVAARAVASVAAPG